MMLVAMYNFLQEKVRELQKEVEWHQDNLSSKKGTQQHSTKAVAGRKSGVQDVRQQQRLQDSRKPYSSQGDPAAVTRKRAANNENACSNTRKLDEDKQLLQISTAQAIQTALECQSERLERDLCKVFLTVTFWTMSLF